MLRNWWVICFYIDRFGIMAKPTYDKPPVTISDQLDILEEKGMAIK